jgi:tRNA threonylcarbamoyladenosine biosynthesis protein TsaE
MEPRGRDDVTPAGDVDSPINLSGLTVTSESPDDTSRVGEILGRFLRPGDLVLLQGNLGAGKTTFTQGVARGMGLPGPVTSPSFTLANVYPPKGPGVPLYHLDLWRIKSPLEALGIGLDEYLAGDGPCVVEWPDVAAEVLPGEFLQLHFDQAGDARQLAFRPIGERPTRLVEDLRRALRSETRSTPSPSGKSGGAVEEPGSAFGGGEPARAGGGNAPGD